MNELKPGDVTNDSVPLPVSRDESTSRHSGDDREPPLLLNSGVHRLPPPPPPLRTRSPSRNYFPKQTEAAPEPAGEEDLFSLPTRVSTESPVALMRNEGEKSMRRYWIWGASSMVALIASVSVVRATGESESESVARRELHAVETKLPQPVEVAQETSWPVAGEGPCRLSVRAVPEGSTVRLDGEPQGVSPLTLATSCEQHRIDVEHPTHAIATVWGTLDAQRPQLIDVTLAARIDSIAVTTTPAGGMIYLGGRAVGRAPRRIDVLGNTPVTIEIRKPGYRTVVTKVTTTTPHMKMVVPLKRTKR